MIAPGKDTVMPNTGDVYADTGFPAPLPVSTTIGVRLKSSARLYTYQCQRPIKVGDRVNVKLPAGLIITVEVLEVHPAPQLSDKWETKWAVLVQTKENYEDSQNQGSDLGKELGL